MRTTVSGIEDARSIKGKTGTEDAQTVRLLKHLAEGFINCLPKQHVLYLLTKFHPSDISDKNQQAHQERVIRAHTPFKFIKPRTLKESEP